MYKKEWTGFRILRFLSFYDWIQGLLFYWYFSCDMEEKKDEEDSTLNEGEAEVAIAHAKRLVHSGVRAADIGIITPYAAQVQ